jgi:hypothetical protein
MTGYKRYPMVQTRWDIKGSWEEWKRNVEIPRRRERLNGKARRPNTQGQIEMVSVIVNDPWKRNDITAGLTMLSTDRCPVLAVSCSFTGLL